MNLHLHIDPQSGLPVYRQMIDQIKYYVASGALKPGQQLPSVRDLAQRLSINPTTVVKAYNELESEHVIELHHGKGAFVSERADSGVSAFEKDKVVRRLARQLAVESQQIGASYEFVQDVFDEEWQQLSGAMKNMRKAAEG
jgi:GntR family transcriptional regulator